MRNRRAILKYVLERREARRLREPPVEQPTVPESLASTFALYMGKF